VHLRLRWGGGLGRGGKLESGKKRKWTRSWLSYHRGRTNLSLHSKEEEINKVPELVAFKATWMCLNRALESAIKLGLEGGAIQRRKKGSTAVEIRTQLYWAPNLMEITLCGAFPRGRCRGKRLCGAMYRCRKESGLAESAARALGWKPKRRHKSSSRRVDTEEKRASEWKNQSRKGERRTTVAATKATRRLKGNRI